MRNPWIRVGARLAAACVLFSLLCRAVTGAGRGWTAGREARRAREADTPLAGWHGELRGASRRKRQLGRRRPAGHQSEQLRNLARPAGAARPGPHQGRAAAGLGAGAARLSPLQVHQRRAVHALQAFPRSAVVCHRLRRRAHEHPGKPACLPVSAGRLPHVPDDLHGRPAPSDGQGSGAQLSRPLRSVAGKAIRW